ncbi:hypothetical protein TNCV_3615821 [Trichonephila clavipes]|nr:hypothetical protein TNCV_3615821 [Trichonephila clavipes]
MEEEEWRKKTEEHRKKEEEYRKEIEERRLERIQELEFARIEAEKEAKAVEERRKIEEERRMNETIALEEEMRLKKERWPVEEKMRHVQDKHKMSMKTEDETYEGKEETPVDVIKDKAKGDINPVFLSKERVDLDDDESEEEKPKLPYRKPKQLSRMTGAKLQQKVNLKASSNIILVPQHWSFKRKYSQNKGGIEKLA